MYQFAVSFAVPAERREDFIAEALRTPGARWPTSRAACGSTRRRPDDELLFHLNEAYEDKAAVELHKARENFQRFIKAVSEYADGPTRRFTGMTVEDPATS